MRAYTRIASLKPQPKDSDNRIYIEIEGVVYSVNQRVLDRYATEAELKAAIDAWTLANLGYVLDDLWVHKNRDGTWAIATGEEPLIWPEDE